MDNVQMVAAAHLGVAQNVLVQRAAEIDVEELQAAADADDGLSRAQKFVNKSKLTPVTAAEGDPPPRAFPRIVRR